MRGSRRALFMALLVVTALVLAGCGPRPGAVQQPEDSAVAVSLPSLVIDFNSQGQASVGSLPLADFGRMLNMDLSAVQLDPTAVSFFTNANIQHLVLDNTPTGLDILVNGRPIPSLSFNSAILASTGELFSSLGIPMPDLNKLLPLIANFGAGVTVRFPVATGAEVIPVINTGVAELAAEAQAMTDEFLAQVGQAPRFEFVVDYSSDGTYTAAGLTGEQWAAATGMPLNALNLRTEFLAQADAAGIDTIRLWTTTSGLHISVNDKELPGVSLGGGRLISLFDLLLESGMLDSMLGNDPSVRTMLESARSLLPIVQTAELNVTVNLP